MIEPAAAAAVASSLAAVGYALGWLTLGGASAAAFIGTAVIAGGGAAGATLLAVFFVSASLLTKLANRTPTARVDRQSGGRRPRQVFANGLWAAVAALIAPIDALGWPILLGALAASQADTWATEIGAWSQSKPQLITTGERVTPGTSGGVTARGTLGGIVGAGIMVAVACGLGLGALTCLAGLIGGVTGMLMDSVLGASVQAVYRCERCNEIGEHATHTCGHPARQLRGFRTVDNDIVNLAGSGTGGGAALLSWWLAQS